MVKFIPQFSCWKVSPHTALVVASCAKTFETRVYLVDCDGAVTHHPDDVQFPDLRMLTPCRWSALSARQRSSVRSMFQMVLEGLYGEEHGRSSSCWAEWNH